MEKILLIDGNSIMNRAFYGIMSPMTTKDGKPTNALYGFLNILFRDLEEIKPDYLLIAFDSKTAANIRKQKYEGYKKSRHKMPDDLAEQMPEIKEILDAMNIKHIELSDFEGDDILGTAAKKFSNENIETYILSGDRDLFQLIQNNIKIRIPHTKAGKTETEIFDENKILELKGLKPKDLIEVKALMGDPSDEIPGAPGIGEKTALSLIQEYGTIEKLYECLNNEEYIKSFKPKTRQVLLDNKDLVFLSRELGRINTEADLNCTIDDIRIREWNNDEVIKLFQRYNFRRFMDRFNLESKEEKSNNNFEQELSNVNISNKSITNLNVKDKLFYYIETEEDNREDKIIKEKIVGIGIFEEDGNIAYIEKPTADDLNKIFENENTCKIGYNITKDYVMLKELGTTIKNIEYDIEVAAYDINPTRIKHSLSENAIEFLDLDITKFIPDNQINLFDGTDSKEEIKAKVFCIKKLYEVTIEILKKDNSYKLFNDIEMPLISVLSDMQFKGMLVDKGELELFGEELKIKINELTNEIYEMAGEEFNINSTQQLGTILFEKLKLPALKKNKKGYSTDVDTLEKLSDKHPIINKISDYRTLSKLNSTYVEGLIPYINPKTSRIHSFFHQTITATGRISSTEPNLQNIPTREEIGKNIRKAFKAESGYIFIDADYSQIELRILAHIAKDENMIKAFLNDEDIHREVASKVFDIPFEEVTKEQRSKAKAVNFGIVYGITGFGLAKQIGSSRKEAEEYKESYLSKFNGVKAFMEEIIKKAEKDGYVETLFGRRRYITELKSSNFMTREFGKRVAMNTPIQGTAADIMKIAMNNVYKELIDNKLDAKIILQVHDELLIEAKEEQKEKVKEILKKCMENATKLDIPLKVEMQEAYSWYDAK